MRSTGVKMNNHNTKLHDWVIKEQSNISEIELFHSNNCQDVMAIRLKKDVIGYCKGVSDVHLTMAPNEDTLEGPCIFSFFQETEKEMLNTQIFSLYQYGEENPTKDLAVIRKSRWVRETDITLIRNGEKILHPTCEGISVVLKENVANQILLDVQQIGDLFYSGFSHTEASENIFGVYSLKVMDSLNIIHEIDWDYKIQLHPIEDKTRILISRLEKNMHAQVIDGAKLRFVFQ